jgi:hypothetical protein
MLLKTFLIIFMCIFYLKDTHATQITLITNGTVTGTNGQQAKIFADSLSRADLKTEVAITNQNCALAKLLWQNSNTPTLMLIAHGIDGLTDKNNTACYLEEKTYDIIFWVYTNPYFFCSVSSKTWEDLTRPNIVRTVAIHPENKSAELFEILSKKYNNKIKTVKVNNSSAVLTMAKAQEIDFAFRSGIYDLEVFKDKCLWSSIPHRDLPTIKDVLPEFEKANHTFSINAYLIAKNINPSDSPKIINKLKEAWNSSDMLQIHRRRGYDNFLVDFNSEQEYKNRLTQLIEILKND